MPVVNTIARFDIINLIIKKTTIKLMKIPKMSSQPITVYIIFRMDFFGAAHRWGWGKKAAIPKICHTNPRIMKLDTVMPYLKKTQKI